MDWAWIKTIVPIPNEHTVFFQWGGSVFLYTFGKKVQMHNGTYTHCCNSIHPSIIWLLRGTWAWWLQAKHYPLARWNVQSLQCVLGLCSIPVQHSQNTSPGRHQDDVLMRSLNHLYWFFSIAGAWNPSGYPSGNQMSSCSPHGAEMSTDISSFALRLSSPYNTTVWNNAWIIGDTTPVHLLISLSILNDCSSGGQVDCPWITGLVIRVNAKASLSNILKPWLLLMVRMGEWETNCKSLHLHLLMNNTLRHLNLFTRSNNALPGIRSQSIETLPRCTLATLHLQTVLKITVWWSQQNNIICETDIFKSLE